MASTILTDESLAQLTNLLSIAAAVNIENLIIEPTIIRGADEERTVIILSDKNIPDFGNKSVGINRLSTLATRLNLVSGTEGFGASAEASTRVGSEEIQNITVFNKTTRIEYRTASPSAVKGTPKQNTLQDVPVYAFAITTETIQLLGKGASAMGAKTVVVSARNSNAVELNILDDTNDMFSTTVDTNITNLQNEDKYSFSYKYPLKPFLTLAKHAASAMDGVAVISIGQKGLINIESSGVLFYIIPKFD